VGGDSPMMLMRFPGDPAIMPGDTPRVHSLVLSELLLVAKDAFDTASSNGEATGFSLEDTLEGLISGDTTGEALEEESLLLSPLLVR